MHNEPSPQERHAILTCYDGRIDEVVAAEVEQIRSQGGLLAEKDILRPPGGIHLFTGKSDCRAAFYALLNSLHAIAGTTVLHLWPHTNCRHCGLHHQEKIGSGAQSDLRFHMRSAEKIQDGVTRHFAHKPDGIPVVDVRIILTVDQRIVSIDEANALLPRVPADSGHGSPCLGHSSESAGHARLTS